MAQRKGSGTEVVLYESYAVAGTGDPGELIELLRSNVGNGALSEFDLERVKVPTGGGRAWVIPTLDGEPEVVTTIDGIIVYHREPRAFWKEPFAESGGGTPPDCASAYGDVGVGDPGGQCAVCPNAQWGSKPAKPGSKAEPRGQACKQMKLVCLLRPDSLLPVALFLPPTSVTPLRKYLLGLAARAQRFDGVITRLALDVTKSGDGIDYSVVVPTRLAPLDEKDVARVRAYSDGIRDALDTIVIEQSDVPEGA